jgi:Uma2 family endonuclease
MSTATDTKPNTISTEALSCAFLEHDLEIPMRLRTLADFRQWAHSDEFPDHGRIDFIRHRIEVSMSPEDLASHGSPKAEIARVLLNGIKGQNLGEIYVDRARVSSPVAELSVEPDILFLSYDTLQAERARKVPKANNAPGRYVEIEGAVDLVVEIISDSSVGKDTRRLPPAYFEAGVRELWLIDARGEDLQFQIHHRGETEFQPVPSDEQGFQVSHVFNRRYRLDREVHPMSDWLYDLKASDLEHSEDIPASS